MNIRYPLEPVSVLLLALLFAAGCGQKGPLYLPGDPSEIKTELPRQDASRTEEKEDDEEEDEEELRDNL